MEKMSECRFGRQVGVKLLDNTENADKGRLKTYYACFQTTFYRHLITRLRICVPNALRTRLNACA